MAALAASGFGVGMIPCHLPQFNLGDAADRGSAPS